MRYASLRNSSAVSVVRGRVARERDLFSLCRRSEKVGVRSVIVSAVESCFGVESRTVLMLTSMGWRAGVNAELEGWRRSRDLDRALHTGFKVCTPGSHATLLE
jgi:hypothetical protein